jgi:SAM-dependent methyltransferase
MSEETSFEEAAAAWQKHYPQMRIQFAGVTAALLAAAEPQTGMRVLDLASGTGEPAIPLANAVGPNGSVTATDCSEAMLAALRQNAIEAGVSNIETQTCDGADLPFPAESFDLVTSRWGVMFFADTLHALQGIRRVLKPGKRAAMLVWGPPAPESYFGTMAVPFVKRFPQKADPDAPGPLRFAEAGKLARIVGAAGFTNIRETAMTIPAPVNGTPIDALNTLMELAAPFRQSIAQLPEAVRAEAQSEALSNLGALYDGKVIHLTAPVNLIVAERG